MVINKKTKAFQQLLGMEENFTDYSDDEVWIIPDNSELAKKIIQYPRNFWLPIEEDGKLIDIQIDEDSYNKILNQENQKQINNNFKNSLQNEDYKIIKCMEYFLTSLSDEEKEKLPYDINTLHLKRQVYRNSIQE